MQLLEELSCIARTCGATNDTQFICALNQQTRSAQNSKRERIAKSVCVCEREKDKEKEKERREREREREREKERKREMLTGISNTWQYYILVIINAKHWKIMR